MENEQIIPCLSANIKILHLSDLQFGFANRFVGVDRYDQNADFESFADKIARDVLSIWKTAPDIIVVTGDIAETAAAPEYNIAEKFFNKLLAAFSNKKEEQSKLFFVPGNHDVSWQDTKAAESMSEPYPWYEDKFRNYNSFIKKITKSNKQIFSDSRNYYVELSSRNELLILGFNSAIKNSHRKEDQYGYIEIENAQAAIKDADRIDPTCAIPRMAIMHHNFTRASENDEENLRDADEIRRSFEEGRIDFILHGHRHSSSAELRRNLIGQRQIAILSAGSAGLDINKLPDVPNQIQMIVINNLGTTLRTTVYRRAFSIQTIGAAGKGVWKPDSSEASQGVFTFYFHREKIREILEAIQNKLRVPFLEEKEMYCPRGFETHELYNTLLDISNERLWILGRKNRKLFDKDHEKGLMKIAKQKNSFDLRIMFLSPNAPRDIIEHSLSTRDKDIDQLNALDKAKKMCSDCGINIYKCCRMYDVQRTIAMFIIDNACLYHKICFDSNGKPERITNTPFKIVCTDSESGRELEKYFLNFWNNGENFQERKE